MQDLFDKVDSDEKFRKLFELARKVYRDSELISNLDPSDRIVENLDDLATIVRFLKIWGAHIVLTMGTFDLLHVGHARYIRKARQKGNLLILGLDDDVKARGRKGENRPAVPYEERSELLTYLRYVDIIVKKSHKNEKWEMIKIVRPHTLIAVVGTYEQSELDALKEFCDEVVVLERQAETSTSAKIRRMILDGADNFQRIVAEELPAFVKGLYERMKKG